MCFFKITLLFFSIFLLIPSMVISQKKSAKNDTIHLPETMITAYDTMWVISLPYNQGRDTIRDFKWSYGPITIKRKDSFASKYDSVVYTHILTNIHDSICYPDMSRESGIQSTEIVELWIDKTGKFISHSLSKSGNEMLGKFLLKAMDEIPTISIARIKTSDLLVVYLPCNFRLERIEIQGRK